MKENKGEKATKTWKEEEHALISKVHLVYYKGQLKEG